MSSRSSALPAEVHTRLSEAVRAEGRVSFSQRAGVSISVIERGLAFGRVSPMALRLITAALEAKPSKDLPAA